MKSKIVSIFHIRELIHDPIISNYETYYHDRVEKINKMLISILRKLAI